jgi:hypothetical protein
MSAAQAGASAAMTAALAAVIADDEHRRRAEGYDDLISYDSPISAPWRWYDFAIAAIVIAVPTVVFLGIWYTE